MCLASCGFPVRPPVPFAPTIITPTSPPLEVTDGLVDFANDLLDHAPLALRQDIFTRLGIELTSTAVIPYLSVAHFMGRKEEHAEVVRLLVALSTVSEVRAS